MSRKPARPPAQLRSIEESLPICLLKAREAVMARFRPVLQRHGFTEQQWRVVRVLAERGTLDAGRLAHASCIRPASLTRILRDLQRRKILCAASSLRDSRRLEVGLTEAGRARFAEIGPESERIYRGLEREVGAAELAATLHRVRALTEQLSGAETRD